MCQSLIPSLLEQGCAKLRLALKAFSSAQAFSSADFSLFNFIYLFARLSETFTISHGATATTSM